MIFTSLEQSSEWLRVQSSLKGRVPVFGEGADSVRVIEQEAGLGLKWWWVPGVTRVNEELAKSLRLRAQTEKVLFCRIEPWIEVGEEVGKVGREVEESYLPRHTLVLDLDPSEEELLAQMEQKGRYNIRQAQKMGVEVRREDERGVKDFYRLLADTGNRDGFGVHPQHFYEAVFKELKGKARLYTARFEGEVVAGILVIYWEDTAIYYFGASSSADRKSYASYLLQWTAILEAKAEGMKVYDFFGVAPEEGGDRSWAGITQFKTRFGGRRVAYHPAQLLVFQPFWYAVYRLMRKLKWLRKAKK